MKKEFFQKLLSWLIFGLIAVSVSFFIITFIGQRVIVDGKSMEPTLCNGDNMICDKLSYRFQDPERFDIVVLYPFEESKDERWIKRIIGLPGEKVRIDPNGTIYINGEPLEEDYGNEVLADPGIAIQEIQLGEDEYWCMGDNRNSSVDSRYIGAIPRDRIIGKSSLKYYPFECFGLY